MRTPTDNQKRGPPNAPNPLRAAEPVDPAARQPPDSAPLYLGASAPSGRVSLWHGPVDAIVRRRLVKSPYPLQSRAGQTNGGAATPLRSPKLSAGESTPNCPYTGNDIHKFSRRASQRPNRTPPHDAFLRTRRLLAIAILPQVSRHAEIHGLGKRPLKPFHTPRFHLAKVARSECTELVHPVQTSRLGLTGRDTQDACVHQIPLMKRPACDNQVCAGYSLDHDLNSVVGR